MSLDDDELRRLLQQVTSTREDEVDCDGCLAGMAAFVEAELRGTSIPVALRRIDAHVRLCPECAEEYTALRAAVAGGPPTGA